MVTFGIVIILIAALSGAPIFAVLLASAMLGFWAVDIPLAIVAVEVYRIVDTPLLVVLPLFTYSGYLLAAAKTSERLVDVAQSLFGWLPSGLALVGFVVCAIFTALTGASGVTIVALGALLLPALVRTGYTEKFGLGLVTTSGSLGLLLVPSVPLILYGILVQQMEIGEPFTIVQLFLAGILPMLLMLLLLIAYTLYVHRGGIIPRVEFSSTRMWSAIKSARWELPLPLVILGGIYSGYFAVSEAAAVTAVYVTIVEVLIYKEVPWRRLPNVMIEAMVMVGGILLVLGVALAFANFLVDVEVPQKLFLFAQEHIHSKIEFLLLLNVILLVLGAFLDIFSALVVVVPLILPVAIGYGVHPVHLGIIFLANMQIGYFTPPVGMNLFVASYRFRKPIQELYLASWPFMCVLLVALILITYVPWISLVFL